MGQNPSKSSKQQAYPLANPAFYPPPPVMPYQAQHYAYPQPTLGHHVITPYPVMMVDGNHPKRRKTRRKSGAKRRPTRKPVPSNPGRPSSRAGGTTMLRVTNSTAEDQDEDTPEPGPSVQPTSHHTPGPERYIPHPDVDAPVVPGGTYPPFDEGADTQPVHPRPPGSRTPYPVHTAPSSMQFTPHTRALRNFPVDSDEDEDDEDDEPPVIPTHSRGQSQSRGRAGSVSGHGHGGDIRRAATPGIALTRRATTGTVPVEFNRHPLPQPPRNLTQSTPWQRLRDLDINSGSGHDASVSVSGHRNSARTSSHGHGTGTVNNGNPPASSHGHSRVRSVDTHQAPRIAVQPSVQPSHTSDHHRSKTVGSFFRRGGIGAGVGHVGGGIWRRVSQRKRHPNRPQVDLDEEFVQVEPPTPAPQPAPAPPEGTITPFTLRASDLRPAASRPVTPAPPPPVLDTGDHYSSSGVPPPNSGPEPVIPGGFEPTMTPRSTQTRTPGPSALGLSQPSRPVTPIGITGTATPGIATPALGLTQPPQDMYRPPTAASTYAPAQSAYDTATTRPTSYVPQPSYPPPPSSSQPQYSTVAPPVTFTQSQPPLNAFLNHSQFRVIHTNPIAPGQPPVPVTYPTGAHLFEALKFLPRHPEHAYAISQTPNIADVYRMSSQWDADVRPDWGSVFLSQMEEVLMAKFRQHHQLRLLLFSTGVTGSVGPHDRQGRELVYEDDRDKFWGRGLDGVGRNELGKALMRVRERLITEGYVANVTQ